MLGGEKDSEKVGVDGKIITESDETPKVNGFGFVATPQIHPGECSKLMYQYHMYIHH